MLSATMDLAFSMIKTPYGLLQLSILNFVVPVRRHRSSPPIREDRQDDGAARNRGDIDRASPYEDIDVAEGVSDDEISDEPQDPVVSDPFAQKWVTRLISATQEPPRDITRFLIPGITLPIVNYHSHAPESERFRRDPRLKDAQGRGFQG
ncbi:hypothetical protein CEK26_008341 [Fusarium fujikuroi]|nr:uncharacterized protein Y057_2391 [Fusarium fujikuroi]QGI64387.1 hypothetical protein CEK27_008358 [Fusarium fujikuroi]QGI81650.1 hypothetical protein CEK25_008379 [Fusarium fujikuroi]QGI95272.1 hypothetical protein CEK26_008341 [Fusarium fujikuroi]VTT57993.1 unnamed protein product [Fusarium fujikuroi]